ncbi:MAG: SpoIIE family protein phosphatase, partial [Treponema sp.]|nr:SpoIIE family protein phosphatase [Treponema sp.]
GVSRELPVSGSALGFAQSSMYSERTEQLVDGDIIVLNTDGLVEAGASKGSAPVLSLRDILVGVPYGAEYHKRLLERALEMSGAQDFDDDVTIVTARIE